ncbi:MAG: GNAT family N-acetyltransferase [Dehalococcoidales bacterium]|nr:GNAT family N-acetyltransferase [Dehalococcoidales bacterium]
MADIFAGLWCEKYDTKITHTIGQKIHRLDKVNDVSLSPGKFRVATMADKELVEKWSHAFYIDIGGEEMNMPEPNFMPALEIGWIFLWEDGRPVSMAVKTRPTGKGMTVGGVYTPPELRGRGYATSCVTEVSRNILKTGNKFCTLYTDLANPTSNSIYKKIGYKEVADSVQHTFAVPE